MSATHVARRGAFHALALVAGLLAALLLVAGCGHVHQLVLRYTAQQPRCSQAQAGLRAVVVGDGRPFVVVCRGGAWDAQTGGKS